MLIRDYCRRAKNLSKIEKVERTKDRFDSAIEIILYLSGVIAVVFAIGGLILGLVVLPPDNALLYIGCSIAMALVAGVLPFLLILLLDAIITAAIKGKKKRLQAKLEK